MKRHRVHVTDHAVLRYLERECGVPVDEIRHLIAKGCEPYLEHAPVNIKTGSIKFVLVGNKVITTLRKTAPSAAREVGQ